jgi:PAS domain S-box-containing protein
MVGEGEGGAAAEREQRLLRALDSARAGTFEIALDTLLVSGTDGFGRLYGFPDGSPRPLDDYLARVHPDDRELVVASATRSATEGTGEDVEHRVVRGDGSVAWIASRSERLSGPDGAARYLVGTAIDVSERREAEDTVRRQLAEIEAIYQGAPVGLCVLDRDLRWVRINDRLAEINGPPAEAHIGRHITELLPELSPEVEPMFRRILETGEPLLGVEVTGETPARPGVQRVWIESFRPLRSPDGEIVGVNITAEEVTEQRKVELLRETFIGMLSHELRTPMTTLYAASQLLRRSVAADGRDQELIEEVTAGTERLHRIVENLLVLARIEHGAALPGTEPVLLQHELPRVVGAERMFWPGNPIRLAPLPRDLPPVHSDPDGLTQVLRNVIGNAVKYGPTGGTVELAVEADQEVAAIHVRDHGPGLGTEDPDRLFDLYYRGRAMASRAAGSGIGLFVSRALVEAMGGSISARSRDAGGAEFTISLRVFAEEA